jgi:hypothetical protein
MLRRRRAVIRGATSFNPTFHIEDTHRPDQGLTCLWDKLSNKLKNLNYTES